MSTKFVLIAAITDCFYVGGKPPEKGSVNGYFFAVNSRRLSGTIIAQKRIPHTRLYTPFISFIF